MTPRVSGNALRTVTAGGTHRALRLGSRDPMFLYHAGMASRAAGERDLARRRLARALAANPRFSPLYAPRAERALRGLGR